MKTTNNILVLIFLVATAGSVSAQTQPTNLFRLYEDNDFFNLSGHGTDESYSAGTRVEYFYTRHGRRRGLDKIMPRLKNSNDVYSWGATQLIYTPTDIRQTGVQTTDYMYAGALFLNHSIYSYNSEKRNALRTDFIAGVRGPHSYAQQVQSGVHQAINDAIPQGWDNQLKGQVLVNVNVTYEQQLWSYSDFLELNAGAQAKVGSMTDAVSVYPMVRLGKMSRYFDGYINQYTSFQKGNKKVTHQYYVFFRPSASVVMYNAMVEGHTVEGSADGTWHPTNMEHHVFDFQFGAVVVLNRFGISYMQTTTKTYIDGGRTHVIGNMSLTYSW